MNVIDQNSAVSSLDEALIPGSSLIDGRTELDRLGFLSDFASLINFYDNENNANGNWSPFLLKDPVFLLASISGTKFSKFHSLYVSTCQNIQQIIEKNKDIGETGISLNQLFDQLIDIFIRIERWTYYMQRSGDEYDLKKYVIHQVKATFSGYFWAILSLKESLSVSSAVSGIQRVFFDRFDSYDELTWKQNRDKRPYWEVLDIGHQNTIKKSEEPTQQKKNALVCLQALTRSGDELFDFFQTIIQHSTTEFEKLQTKKSRYPDTTLLRAFVNLLKVHKDQLNDISDKHLEFYYKDILKQVALPALPDNVFVCAELAKQDAAFDLPAGTFLSGGLDANKKPIVFVTGENVTLNPAAIVSAATLTRVPDTASHSFLYMETTSGPGALQKDENGNTLSWETFGGSVEKPAALVNVGIAFASPMLLLREGRRTITLILHYTGDMNWQMLTEATYYLSTQTTWFQLAKDLVNVLTVNNEINQASIEIQLKVHHPPIESFLNLQNPDGLNSAWPMLKIEFKSIISKPPVLIRLDIQVSVTHVKTFQLYSDSGMLSTKTPYPLFGTTPVVNSSFIIGSNEIFSKPLDSLYIELHWDKLPDNGFQSYYQEYNNIIDPVKIPDAPIQNAAIPGAAHFVNKSYAAVPPKSAAPVNKPDKKINRIIRDFVNFFKCIVHSVAEFFHENMDRITKSFQDVVLSIKGFLISIQTSVLKLVNGILDFLPKKPIPEIEPAVKNARIPFNNTCFTVDFNLLQSRSWQKFQISKQQYFIITDSNGIQSAPYKNNPGCIDPVGTPLFDTVITNNPTCNLGPRSFFAYGAASSTTSGDISSVSELSSKKLAQTPADPYIQTVPLKFSDTSTSGFMKIILSGPKYGFGSPVYSNIVSSIAMQNAVTMTKIAKHLPAPHLIPSPNVPFVPKLADFTAHYKASHTYELSSERESYPIQCFLYSPFASFMVYDNSTERKNYEDNFVTSITDFQKITEGVPLFPSFDHRAALFLEVENLVPSNELSIYFELARNFSGDYAATKAQYGYLSKKGWKPLDVLSDETNNFSCSGITKVNIPEDISNTNPVMAGNKYWLSIAVADAPSAFSRTVFLKTNGFKVRRSGSEFLSYTQSPKLAACSIAKPQAAIPQIAALVQPFPSFGGKAAENKRAMNRRVSNRLKTKDRAVSAEDFYRLIRQEFSDIYYSKTVRHLRTKSLRTYVVKVAESATDANAFVPLISQCREKEIESFLLKRTSAFANIEVLNFDLQQVSVIADILIRSGYEKKGLEKKIKQALDIFLSPWIANGQQQIHIDSVISNIEAAKFIKSIEGVSDVERVSFRMLHTRDQSIITAADGTLFVSSQDHTINFSN